MNSKRQANRNLSRSTIPNPQSLIFTSSVKLIRTRRQSNPSNYLPQKQNPVNKNPSKTTQKGITF